MLQELGQFVQQSAQHPLSVCDLSPSEGGKKNCARFQPDPLDMRSVNTVFSRPVKSFRTSPPRGSVDETQCLGGCGADCATLIMCRNVCARRTRAQTLCAIV